MFVTLPLQLTTNDWISVNSVLGIPVGTYLKIYNNSNKGCYLFKGTQPSNDYVGGALLTPVFNFGSIYECHTDAAELWVRGVGGLIAVETGVDTSVPAGLYTGTNAIVNQSYDEANKKNGTQFSASRRIPAAVQNVHSLSIIKTTNKPIDLKKREFACSGDGVIADIFENPVYTGGVEDPVFNSNGMVVQDFDFQLLTGFTITGGVGTADNFPANYGTKFSDTLYVIGSKSAQGKGVPSALYGSNYILAPNTSYLLVFYSIDALASDVAVRIEGYNGYLDFPTIP